MPLVTTIRWRPYPEQKPPHTLDGGVLYVLFRNSPNPFEAIYNEGTEEFSTMDERYGDYSKVSNVTHFALPSDITTQEEA